MILTFNQKEWKTSINDLIADYAKKNSIDYYFNYYFKLVLIIDNNSYIVDTYNILNDTLKITLKEIKKWDQQKRGNR